MKQLKFFMFILLAITIFSCYSNKLGLYYVDIIWEPTDNLPNLDPDLGNWYITVATDGNIWTYYGNKLYLSTDNGDTWIKKNNIPFSLISSLIVVNPVNGYIFASCNNGYTDELGLYRSTDNGENWEHILDNVSTTIGVLCTTSGEIYVGAAKKLFEERESVCYYSNDNGNTWIEKSKGLPAWFSPDAVGKDGTLYARTKRGVYRSTDDGNTWLPPSNYDTPIFSLAICDSAIFVTTNIRVSDRFILKSTDKGRNWNTVNTGFDDPPVPYRIISNLVTNDIFVINYIRSSIYQQDYNELYRSSNLGKYWKSESSGFPDQVGWLAVNPKTGQMFAGTPSGVYRTKNYPK